jgi:hypothetical protein
MSSSERYPAMDHIFSVYFGQDFDLFGQSVPEIVACYKKDSPHDYENLIREIDTFRGKHLHDLDATFKQLFRRGFRPEGLGYTTTSFLDEICRVLSE